MMRNAVSIATRVAARQSPTRHQQWLHGQRIFMRYHSTEAVENSVSNSHGRLRIPEERYAAQLSSPIPSPVGPLMDKLKNETLDTFPKAHMMVSETQAKLLHQLVRLLRPDNVLEIGTFTGYSTLAMASALQPHARLVSLEKDSQSLALAKKYTELAGLDTRITYHLGSASKSLEILHKQSLTFDFCFLDANKKAYIDYLDYILTHNLLTPRGVVIADNVLFFGQVHRVAGYEDPFPVEASKNIRKVAAHAHAFNQYVANDPRVQVIMLPLFDGVSIIQRK